MSGIRTRSQEAGVMSGIRTRSQPWLSRRPGSCPAFVHDLRESGSGPAFVHDLSLGRLDLQQVALY